jgi:hypothetical protein
MNNAMTGQDPDSGQLDLFVHSRAVILTNDTISALLAREAAQASACLGRLGAEVPDHGPLTALKTLSRALSEWPLRSTSPAEIAAAVEWIQGEVHPAALATMASKAEDFMRPFWQDLAHAARSHPYDASFPQSFRAGLYLRCGDVLSIALAEIDDPLLHRDWSAFHSACDWLDPDDETADAWFPAWYLVEHPGVPIRADNVTSLPTAQAAQTFFAIARLLELEKGGYSAALISSRRRLRDLDSKMFAFYMARRHVDHR